MQKKIEVTLEAIIHATEDVDKVLASLETFGIQKGDLIVTNLVGHFDNPIIMLKARKEKKEGEKLVQEIVERIPKEDIETLIEDGGGGDEGEKGQRNLENHIHNSTLYLRISKQDLVAGKVLLKEDDAIKIKITIPVFNKKKKLETFASIFKTRLS